MNCSSAPGSGQTQREGLLFLEAPPWSPSPDHRERGDASLHSSLEQLKPSHPMPLTSSSFIENLLCANTLVNHPASQASEGGSPWVGIILFCDQVLPGNSLEPLQMWGTAGRPSLRR